MIEKQGAAVATHWLRFAKVERDNRVGKNFTLLEVKLKPGLTWTIELVDIQKSMDRVKLLAPPPTLVRIGINEIED